MDWQAVITLAMSNGFSKIIYVALVEKKLQLKKLAQKKAKKREKKSRRASR